MVDQVIEQLTSNGDAQGIHVCEIGGSQVAGPMHLTEDDWLPRPVAGSPLPDAAFEGATLRIGKLTRVLLTQPVKECLGQEFGLGLELGFHLGPDCGKRIGPGAVGAGPLLTHAGQRGILTVMAGRLLRHPCPPGRIGQRPSLIEQKTQLAYLAIRDHDKSPRL